MKNKKIKRIPKQALLFMFCAILLRGGLFFSAASTDDTVAFQSNYPCIEASASSTTVYLGGVPFGVKFYTEGVTVVGFSQVETDDENKSPAYNAGLREYDVILSVNSAPVSSAKDFISMTEGCEGKPIAVDYKRMGKIMSASFTPVLCKNDGKYKTGMWIKDSTAGIGTVTYFIPETKKFAGLGHSICDCQTGEILPLTKGIVMDVSISGVEKGTSGDPGELKGTFSGEKIGALLENKNEGVFGMFIELPAALSDAPSITVATQNEISEGDAKIRCTVDGSTPSEYAVMLTHIDFEEPTNKNFIIEITDQSLLEKTGGIVQGMSGSPILQNGKLVGAVTHVLVNDPTRGYGIFIENMLETAQSVAENNKLKEAS